MPRLTPVHWKKFDKFLLAAGCVLAREHGDHRIYWREGLKRPLVIPRAAALPLFIIRNNLRVLGVSVQEYLDALSKL